MFPIVKLVKLCRLDLMMSCHYRRQRLYIQFCSQTHNDDVACQNGDVACRDDDVAYCELGPVQRLLDREM